MPIEIKALTEASKNQVYEAFTKAFENYFTPLVFNEKATLERWDLAGIRYDLSYGVFDNSLLVTFVLQSHCGESLYNFCTGVIPTHRGQHLIEAIYEKIDTLPGFKKDVLEVIKENVKACNLYKKLGFTPNRKLLSFQGSIIINAEERSGLTYRVLPLHYTEEMLKIKIFNPAMENSHFTTQKKIKSYELHEIREESKLIAYAIYHPMETGLKELGAIDSLEENLDQLLIRMKLNNEKIRIMNIDENAKDLIEYVITRGLRQFITQYEMIRLR